ncbi:MAG: glycosyltransferase family 2 protein [Geminicoccaceae bacterium]
MLRMKLVRLWPQIFKQIKTAVCVIVKNERNDISEWIAYHLAIGFDTVLLFDNMSDDDTSSIVDVYARKYDVRRVAWSDTSTYYQVNAYNAALEMLRQDYDWLCFIDADEFVLLKHHVSIREFVADFPSCAAIAVNWAIFGSSGLQQRPDGLVIENFLQRSDASFAPNRHVKCFVQPRRTNHCVNAHYFEVDGSIVSPLGKALNWELPGLSSSMPEYDIAQINHYFVKSSHQWADKMKRGYHDIKRSVDLFSLYDRNDVFDKDILSFAPKVHKIMNKLERQRAALKQDSTISITL